MLEPEQGNVSLFLANASLGSLEVPINSRTGVLLVALFDTELIRQQRVPPRCINHETGMPPGDLAIFTLRCDNGSCATGELCPCDSASFVSCLLYTSPSPRD